MKPINVETLMGHSTGISDSYYRPTEKELLEDYLKAVPLLTLSEAEEKNVITAENIEIAFSPPYNFRQKGIRQMTSRTPHPRFEYSLLESKDFQLYHAIDVLKILTNHQIPPTHVGFVHYYAAPQKRIYFETDLYEKNAKILAKFYFKKRVSSFPDFWNTKEVLLYETAAIIVGNEITLPINNTPLDKYIEDEASGSFVFEVAIQKQTNSQTQKFHHKTIVMF